MPRAQLFFGNDQRSGDQQLAGASPLAFNVLIDGAGAIRRRPGISEWSGFPGADVDESVIGINSFGSDIYFVTGAQRRIYKLSAGVLTNMSTAGASSFLAGTGRPFFAETQFRLVIAGGLALSKVDTGAVAAGILGGSPPNCTQVSAISQRLVVDDNTSAVTEGRIRFSGPGDAGNETWSAFGFVPTEARPDDLVALRDNANELFAWGERTLQVFSPDPNRIFAPGRAINRGCSAAASVVPVDESFGWLDEQKQLVLSDGRSMEVTSDSIAGTLDSVEDVSDCWGLRVNMDQFDVLGWVFPTDGRTFVYQRGGGWSQWSGWNGQGHTPWRVQSHYFWPEENRHLVGLEDGSIAELSVSAHDDLGDTIKAEVRTGFINHDTDSVKVNDVLRLTIKRGVVTNGAEEPQLLLSWRDDSGAFCNPRRIGLGVVGDDVFTKELRALGSYRRRQWRIEFTDASEFVLASVEEVFTIGGSN